jgi:hypothetical protein
MPIQPSRLRDDNDGDYVNMIALFRPSHLGYDDPVEVLGRDTRHSL